MRTPLIVANWKMNKIRDEALNFIYSVQQEVPNREKVETVVCAQAILLRCLVKRQGDNLRIGAQNMHYLDNGPYTGEMSPLTLVTTGVTYVILGHSERRTYYNENDEMVNKKVISALKYGLIPIICIGETLEQYKNNESKNVVNDMLKKALKNVLKEDVHKIIISYEPIWAIGTGHSADRHLAEAMAKDIREVIRTLYENVADEVRILYGGSVSPVNLKSFLDEPDIDGALVGNASLDANNFIEMIKIALN